MRTSCFTAEALFLDPLFLFFHDVFSIFKKEERKENRKQGRKKGRKKDRKKERKK